MNIWIKNGRFINPANGADAKEDAYIADGKIAAVGKRPSGFEADRAIDASGLVVCPGLVDLSVRLREPGFEYRATLESEMKAAVAGGVTSLACPPDTDPPLDEPGLVEMLKYRAKSLNQARVYPIGALTAGLRGERITEMAELADAGCIAFSQANVPIADTMVLLHALQYAATFGFRVWLSPQDAYLSRDGVAHDGEVATRLGLAGIPTCAETVALSTLLLLTRETGAKVHFARISSAEGVEMIARARQNGIAVTCDIAGTHAHLTEMDLGFFNSQCHLVPPLRGLRDRDALLKGLAEGVIDALTSDHTPVDDDAKQVPFAETEAGASGVELLLSLTLKWAIDQGVPLAQALAKVTINPARIMGIEAGDIAPGKPADLCLFDPEAYWKIEPQALKSQGKNSPFLNLELPGRVRYTLVVGEVVHENLET
ncbi:MAG: dihydroorotase [Burkholderiales bacterium]